MDAVRLRCGHRKMLYDEACLHIQNFAQNMVNIQYQITECYKCSFLPFMDIYDAQIKKQIVKTTYGTNFRFNFDNNYVDRLLYFEQHGHYGINILQSNVSEHFTISPPNNANTPLYSLLWALFIGIILWNVGFFIMKCTPLYSRLFQPYLIVNEAENDLGAVAPSRSENTSPLFFFNEPDVNHEIHIERRIKSLDVFRGITITLMLFVNYGGGKYWIFQHSPWNGITIADVIFPWFAWIMGASLILSINSHLRNSVTKKKIFMKVILRSITIFVIGIVLNSMNNNNVETLRFLGVLQRLSLAYMFVAVLETFFLTRPVRYYISGRIRKVEEWLYCWIQCIVMVCLVGTYYCFVSYLNVPGCPKGYLGPGGLHMNGSFANCTGGAVGYVDRIFLNNHLYNGTLVSSVYHNELPFDPEGLLGTLTTAFTVFMGAHASRIILCYRTPNGRLTRWLIIAIILGLLGGHFCGWSKEEGSMPLNKNLWSISFAFVTSSLAFLLKSILFYIVDYQSWWSGAPFHQMGKSAILVYIGHIITKDTIPWNFKPLDYSTHSTVLWMNVWSTSLWIIIAVILDVCNIHVRI
ncbi:hypothetical protein O3M35_008791 [Rhynocoris fuscipes]|uniref:Heparan-alpha-glucosaminide N-acetyltransferase n=1 Tax=Rhynocoris fuscipes TaxID=488301 RepID=A0AAW1D7G6_9HEMI